MSDVCMHDRDVQCLHDCKDCPQYDGVLICPECDGPIVLYELNNYECCFNCFVKSKSKDLDALEMFAKEYQDEFEHFLKELYG